MTDRMPDNTSAPIRRASLPMRILRFYIEGFRSMTVGRKLWALIIIKVIILLGVFKLWLMPDMLKSNYDNDADRARAVRSSLIQKK